MMVARSGTKAGPKLDANWRRLGRFGSLQTSAGRIEWKNWSAFDEDGVVQPRTHESLTVWRWATACREQDGQVRLLG